MLDVGGPSWSGSVADHDDAVVVAVGDLAGFENDAAELDGDISLARGGFGAFRGRCPAP